MPLPTPPCAANYEPVDAGLKKAWNPATGTFTVTKLVRCRETACPRTHPKRCGDYCAQAEVDCPEVIWPLDATPRPCDFYDRVTQIIAPRSTALNKGTWGGWALVPPGRNYLPYGFSLKWEGRQGPSDDTALNAVRLLWEDNNGNGRVLKVSGRAWEGGQQLSARSVAARPVSFGSWSCRLYGLPARNRRVAQALWREPLSSRLELGRSGQPSYGERWDPRAALPTPRGALRPAEPVQRRHIWRLDRVGWLS